MAIKDARSSTYGTRGTYVVWHHVMRRRARRTTNPLPFMRTPAVNFEFCCASVEVFVLVDEVVGVLHHTPTVRERQYTVVW